jgi:aspartokinase
MKGICKKIIDRSVEENIDIADINEKNINMSLTLDQTKVFNAAFIVYILEE